jgi:hypothetical protein
MTDRRPHVPRSHVRPLRSRLQPVLRAKVRWRETGGRVPAHRGDQARPSRQAAKEETHEAPSSRGAGSDVTADRITRSHQDNQPPQ